MMAVGEEVDLAGQASSLPVSAFRNGICLFGSPKGIKLAGQYGKVFWQMCNSVIIISLTTAHQRGITSEHLTSAPSRVKC